MEVKFVVVAAVMLLIGACANSGPVPVIDTAKVAPYVGNYVGTEILEGGNFRITIEIQESGKVRVRDIDGRIATGYLLDTRFVAKRGGATRQIFSGEVNGNKITGLTTENVFLGPGTFSAVRSQ
jgi:hypothetical protein